MSDIDLLVLNSVNASLRNRVDALTLASCLTEGPEDAWAEHVRAFFEEVPREAQYRFLLAHRLDARRVLETYHRLFSRQERSHGDLDGWLSELAGAA